MRLPSYRAPKNIRQQDFKGVNHKVSDKRNHIVNDAKSFLGKTHIKVKNKYFNYDCSGFVAAVYLKNGYDLINGNPDKYKSLVRAIYAHVNSEGKIFRKNEPKPGDIVFFSNTYKTYGANELSHVGIVEDVDRDGTITFIHKSSRGIVKDNMNILHPSERKDPKNSKIYNSYLRRKRRNDPLSTKYLAGELFEAYGDILE